MGFMEAFSGSGGGGSTSGPFGFPSIAQMGFADQQNKQASWQADHAMDRADADMRQQEAFTERMSNTAYQRATEDMKKAGINPMVAYQQGGASTPSGGSGTSGIAAPVSNIGRDAIASAFDAARLSNELKNSGSQRALNDAAATKAIAEAGSAGSSAKFTETRNQALSSQLTAIKKRAEVDEKTAGYDSKAVGYDAIMSRANRDAGTANKLSNMFRGGGSSNDQIKPWQGTTKDGTVYDRGTGEVIQP